MMRNTVSDHLKGILRSERMRAGDGSLYIDMQQMLKGHCICLSEFVCKNDDLTLFETLAKELVEFQERQKDDEEEEAGVIKWSRHLKHENPTHSKTFAKIIGMFEKYFDLDIHATRLNLYLNGTHWKPFHHDSHAYGNRGREDFTVGASFGEERSLAWRHAKDHSISFPFPQRNGDVFAFDSVVNKLFQHGVLRGKSSSGPRFSIIAWGRRRTINERNGGVLGSEPVSNILRSLSLESNKDEHKKYEKKNEEEESNLLKVKSRPRPSPTNESVEVDLLSIVNDFCRRHEKKCSKSSSRRRVSESSASKKDFKSRNVALMKSLKHELSPRQFKEFKSLGKSYQSSGVLNAKEFVRKCLDDAKISPSTLSKALSILPNASKRKDALEALRRRRSFD